MSVQATTDCSQVRGASTRPRVVLVGGPDVDARLDLMQYLSRFIDVGALGSNSGLRDVFLAKGFAYNTYRLSRHANPALDLMTLGELRKIFRRVKPEVVHTFDTKPGIWGSIAARWAGVPVVVRTITGLGALYAQSDVRIRLLRVCYDLLQRVACRVADLTVFQNPDDARHFIARGIAPADKTTVIPGSGVQTDVFDPRRVSEAQRARVRAALNLRAGQTIVTMVSRVIRSKGVLEFLRAAQHFQKTHPHVRFLLVGPEDDGSEGRLSAEELQRLRQTVMWPGPRQDIAHVLAVSNVFVLPSVYREGIPRVLLEAASMGLPIVTTDAPGCREVVEDGVNGYLVPAGDPTALGAAIGRLIDRPELRQRFGERSRQLAVGRFDLSVIGEQTRSLYRDLLDRKISLRTQDIRSPLRERWRGDGTSVANGVHPGPDLPSGSRAAGSPINRPAYRLLKRVLDLVMAGSVLAVAWPVMLCAGVAVVLTSPGPMFYRARRAGLGGRPFDMLKLRTMRVDTDGPDRMVTAPEDDRLTRIGRWLRRFRLDELPQFWNVLRGEMSIVGPRPEDWTIVQRHYSGDDWRTLDVSPGLISLAVVQWYPDLMYHDPPPPGVPAQRHYLERHLPIQLAEAQRYVQQQSLGLDLRVMVRAAYCVLVQSWRPPSRRPLVLPLPAQAAQPDIHVNYRYMIEYIRARDIPAARVLDFGCGGGEAVEYGRRLGIDIYGSEIFDGQYEDGGFYEGGSRRALIAAKGFLGTIVKENIGGKIQFPDNYFDIVVSNQVMEHVEDLESALAEICRVLKPGGTFLSNFPDKSVWWESHCGIPFLHWFDKGGTARVIYAYLLRLMGFGYHKRGKGPWRWACEFCDWLDRYTYYRTREEITSRYARHFHGKRNLENEYLAFRFRRHALIARAQFMFPFSAMFRWLLLKRAGPVFDVVK